MAARVCSQIPVCHHNQPDLNVSASWNKASASFPHSIRVPVQLFITNSSCIAVPALPQKSSELAALASAAINLLHAGESRARGDLWQLPALTQWSSGELGWIIVAGMSFVPKQPKDVKYISVHLHLLSPSSIAQLNRGREYAFKSHFKIVLRWWHTGKWKVKHFDTNSELKAVIKCLC